MKVVIMFLLMMSLGVVAEEFDFSKLKCEGAETVELQVKSMLHDEEMTKRDLDRMIEDGMAYGLDESESKKQATRYFRQVLEFNEDQRAAVLVNFEECTSGR